MNVLFVSKPVCPPFHDGAVCLVRDVSTHLQDHRVTVLTTHDAPPIASHVFHDRLYPSAGSFTPTKAANALVLGHLLLDNTHDLWHFCFAPNPVSSGAAQVLRKLRRKHVVQTVASAPRHFENVGELLFGDRIVCMSKWTRDAFVQAGARPAQLEVIVPPLPRRERPSESQIHRARRDAQVANDMRLVVYPGDLEVSCGARVVAESIDAILREHDDVVIAFACRQKTPKAKGIGDSLKQQLAHHGQRVVFPGEVKSLAALLAGSDVVVFPVDDLYGKVDLPIAVLEAMDLGVPVVALRKGPLAELEGVRFIDEAQGSSLAVEVNELLKDSSMRRQVGAEGRAAIERRHRPEIAAQGYAAIYTQLARTHLFQVIFEGGILLPQKIVVRNCTRGLRFVSFNLRFRPFSLSGIGKMGFFDFFKSKSTPPAATKGTPVAQPQDKNVARHARVVGDKLAQAYDRIESIEALCKVQSAEAVSALLKRFTFYVEPGTTDEEEKEVAFRGIVGAGEVALEPIRTYCEKAESLTWPLRMLQELLEEESLINEIIDMLDNRDTDYNRVVEPKVQLIEALEGRNLPEVIEAVVPFLEDVSEPVRFKAVTTLLSLNNPAVVDPMVALAIREESVRVRNKIAEGFKTHGWEPAEADRDNFRRAIAQAALSVGFF